MSHAGEVIHLDFRPSGGSTHENHKQQCLKLLQWNIERGYKLDLIIQQLKQVDADVLSLQEVDVGCERSGYKDTGRGRSFGVYANQCAREQLRT